jgi:hypothetical protein
MPRKYSDALLFQSVESEFLFTNDVIHFFTQPFQTFHRISVQTRFDLLLAFTDFIAYIEYNITWARINQN